MNQPFAVFRSHRVCPVRPTEIARLRRAASIAELMKPDGVELQPAVGDKLPSSRHTPEVSQKQGPTLVASRTSTTQTKLEGGPRGPKNQ